MKNKALLTILVNLFLINSTPSHAMTKNEKSDTVSINSTKDSINFKELKTAKQVQEALQKSYPKGSNLSAIVSDLKLNEQSRIDDKVNGKVFLYHLFDGSKNIHGYNYWKVSITVNSKNQIEQIAVSDGDYQGS